MVNGIVVVGRLDKVIVATAGPLRHIGSIMWELNGGKAQCGKTQRGRCRQRKRVDAMITVLGDQAIGLVPHTAVLLLSGTGGTVVLLGIDSDGTT